MNPHQSDTVAAFAPSYEIWDNSRRAQNVIIVFYILIAITGIGVISDYFQLSLLQHVQNGGMITEEEADASDMGQAVIGILQFGIYILSVVLFLMWFRRAYGNLHRSGNRYLSFRENMAVWAWFIPIIVLFRPFAIMKEIWEETQTAIRKYDKGYLLKNGGILIGIWWVMFLISNFIGRYILRASIDAETLEEIIQYTQAIFVSDIMQIVEALFVIFIVTRLSKMENRLASEIHNSGGQIVYK